MCSLVCLECLNDVAELPQIDLLAILGNASDKPFSSRSKSYANGENSTLTPRISKHLIDHPWDQRAVLW